MAGANAFLPKPIDFSALLSQIQMLLSIEWIYEVPRTQAAAPSMESFIMPPPGELEALHHLARLGDMRAIAQYATQVAGLDERYRPFADHLCQLAKDYQSKAILSFVDRCLERRSVP